MAPTTAGLRHAVRSAAAPFVTLGPRQFTVLAVSLLLYSLLYAILLAPFITQHFARTDVQAHERAFGFRLGLIDLKGREIRDWHIVEVTPGGRFAQAGFRSGDVPSEHGFRTASESALPRRFARQRQAVPPASPCGTRNPSAPSTRCA